MEFGQKLKEARLKAGLKQEDVAKQVGVSRQTMSNWENNRSYPDLASVLKLSDLYGLSVDEMLREDGLLRKKVEQRQENLKRYCSWIHDFGILLMPVAFVLAYFGKTGGGILLAAMSFVIFCVPHVVYVKQFGMPWKLAVLRVISLGMWLTGVMLRRIRGDFSDVSGLVFGGLLLQSFVNYRLRDFNGMITKRMSVFTGFVIAVVLIFAFIPGASESFKKGEFNEYNPFDGRYYRVAEVLHGEEGDLPMVMLGRTNRVYVNFHGGDDPEMEGQFSYVTQPDNSPYKGVWELVPEDAVQERYQVRVERDESVVLAGYNGSEILWEYRLERAPQLWIYTLDLLGAVNGRADWYYEGFLESGEATESVPLRGKGEVQLIIPGGPESLRVWEEHYLDGETEYREFTLERNDKGKYVVNLQTEAEGEYYIYRIPYENGEFVLKIRMEP